uniref:Thioredoxin domain-containing protein n=1 Tax=Meloidogyne incognita TaxID=6306 RepID=A0A914L5Q3_MELIC
MVVKHINSDNEFEQSMAEAGENKLIICDFFVEWCGPCRTIAPIFERFSNDFAQAMFLKIDVDRCQGVAQQYSIRAMPTFLSLLNRVETGRIQGADPNGLLKLINDGLSKITKTGEHVANAAEREWLGQFVHSSERMAIYEDELNQTLALSIIPVDELRQKATFENEVNHYLLAKELLNWFHSFFKWVNSPKCEKCGIEGKRAGVGFPTEDEAQDEVTTVELYNCENCKEELRFPRYNNPAKLLETRKGRCGEYANCFALCCRALGLQTRSVIDNLDHVWVEVWSDQLKRWLHCDPCENVIDTPLIYDKGWGKKHAYVFAFAIDHMQDVTWRYHYDHKEAIQRRTKVREPVLRNFIRKMNARLASLVTDERRVLLRNQILTELLEFLSPDAQLRDGSEAQNQGRRSGALHWRHARGELGAGDDKKENKINEKPSTS